MTSFRCNYIDGIPNGVGTYLNIDGTSATGNFISGVPEGEFLVSKDGEVIEYKYFLNGELVNQNNTVENLAIDYGVSYSGEVLDGVPHGYGILSTNDGRKYEGQFQNGYMNGMITLTFEDGTIFIGNYIDDSPEGIGKVIYTDGTEVEGYFEDFFAAG